MLYIVAFFGFIAFSIVIRVVAMLFLGSRKATSYVVMWFGILVSWAIALTILSAFALTQLAG
jgi:hypothetical protein